MVLKFFVDRIYFGSFHTHVRLLDFSIKIELNNLFLRKKVNFIFELKQFEHQIIAEKLEANRNLLRLNTNDTIILGGTNDEKSVIDAILPLSLIELK